MYTNRAITPHRLYRKLHALQTVGRVSDSIQVLIFLTFGQFLYSKYGAVQLNAPHWHQFRDWAGGPTHLALSVVIIAVIGLIGIFSLAVTEADTLYTIIMWIYSVLAAIWCFTAAGFLAYAMINTGAGNGGPWNWTLAGLFFLFSRFTITISRGLDTIVDDEEPVT